MFKIAMSIIALTSLAHATDKDTLGTMGTSNPTVTPSTYVQPMSDVVYEEIKDPTPSRGEKMVTVASNNFETAKIKGELELQRTKNHVSAEVERFDKKLDKEVDRSEKKLEKAKEKSKDKLKKLKKKSKKFL